MNIDMTQEILDIIRSGDVDERLGEIRLAVHGRMALRPRKHDNDPPEIPRTDFRVGATVEVTGKLKPNYLFGKQFIVNKINSKTVVVDIPNDPIYKRFAGSNGVRIPKAALKVVS